ncbi:MutS-related protein [Niabella aquatica]
MGNTTDLNLETEVLPFFDFTLTHFAKTALAYLFRHPLTSVSEIETRQHIIKGFITNAEIVGNYAYAKQDFYEVHHFLTNPPALNFTPGERLKLMLLEKERHTLRTKVIQFVLLFSKLDLYYFKKINTRFFPEAYKEEIRLISSFIALFNLDFYDTLIREGKLNTKHIITLSKIIAVKYNEGVITGFYKRLFRFEAFLSISQSVIKRRFSFPSFSEEQFFLEQLYHPLLNDPVKNNFSLDKNVLLITGPNMSGKSTFLKSLGICIYLAHLGFAIPAGRAAVPFFDHIALSINHNDSLANGYSHFMNEIIRLKNVVTEAAAGKRCFAVFDELFKGTNMEDAVKISTTTINGLTKFTNSFFIISTHLHQLKEQVKSEKVNAYYVDCEVEHGAPVFKYEIKEGWSDVKVGQVLFRKVGLDELLKETGELI